jgi:threonine dehydratase
MASYDPIPLEEIKAAQKRIAPDIVRTPLIKLNVDDAPAEIYLKLENLQPIGAFKIRGASNALKTATEDELKDGVWAVSSGNHGQGMAMMANKLGIDCKIFAWDTASQTKIDAIERFGVKVERIPYPSTQEEWALLREEAAKRKGYWIQGSHPAAITSNGSIGLEILEDLPDVDAILMPVGGGGLSCGVASAVRALKPDVKLYGCEIETSAPLATSFEAGERVTVERIPSFIDAIGYTSINPAIWEMASKLLDGSLVVSLGEVCKAVRLMAKRNRVIVEGAGAVSVAAALSGKAGTGKIACVVTGGNIDLDKLVKIFQGKIP